MSVPPPTTADHCRSVYLHVPFCRQRCAYCGFYSGEPLTQLATYPALLGTEIDLRCPSPAAPVCSVYFGGGTPGLLPPHHIAAILDRLQRRCNLTRDCEVTLEINPGDRHDLSGLATAGITRLSIGVQALDDPLLAALGRRHTAAQARRLLQQVVRAGFSSVSVDLLLGLAPLSTRQLARWIHELVATGAGHLSLYSLEVHPGTVLADQPRTATALVASAQQEERQYWQARHAATDLGLEAYEVSNFARPGARCRHNLAYWQGFPYLGLGPGAHGFEPAAGRWGRRIWNTPNLQRYAAALARAELPPGNREQLSRDERLLETLFLTLRQPHPVHPDRLAQQFDLSPAATRDAFRALERAGTFTATGSPEAYCPTPATLRRADGLALHLQHLLLHPIPHPPPACSP